MHGHSSKQSSIKVIVLCPSQNKTMVELDQGTAVTNSRDAVPVMRAKGRAYFKLNSTQMEMDSSLAVRSITAGFICGWFLHKQNFKGDIETSTFLRSRESSIAERFH